MLSTDLVLDELLSEDIASVKQRERATFDMLAYPFEHALVLVGAGYMGGKALRALREAGLRPLAFADDNTAFHDSSIQGIPVLSLAKAAANFGKTATFVVTLLRPEVPFVQTRQRLITLGCVKVVSAIALFWKYPNQTMPHAYVDLPSKLVEQVEEVRAAYRLMGDDESKRIYAAQIAYRMRLDFEALPPELDVSEQYFPADLIDFRVDEVFVDCGAYDGDTVKSFIANYGHAFRRLFALEPDPINYQKLKTYVASLPSALSEKVELRPFAVGQVDGTLRFDGRGTNGSLLSDAGVLEVQCRRLDTLFADVSPTYIKMDIEGAEPDALVGVREISKRALPILAVCVYHFQDHLWKIPLQLHALSDSYRLFLRAYMKEGMELVCYAIPRTRLAIKGSE
jgi:FkbM family methyltransferase